MFWSRYISGHMSLPNAFFSKNFINTGQIAVSISIYSFFLVSKGRSLNCLSQKYRELTVGTQDTCHIKSPIHFVTLLLKQIRGSEQILSAVRFCREQRKHSVHRFNPFGFVITTHKAEAPGKTQSRDQVQQRELEILCTHMARHPSAMQLPPSYYSSIFGSAHWLFFFA